MGTRRRFNSGPTGAAMQAQEDKENGIVYGGTLPEVVINGNRVATYGPVTAGKVYDMNSGQLYSNYGTQITDPEGNLIGNSVISYDTSGIPADTVIYDPKTDSLYTSGNILGRTRTPGYDQKVGWYNGELNNAYNYRPSYWTRIKNMAQPFSQEYPINSSDVYPVIPDYKYKIYEDAKHKASLNTVR